MTPPASFPIQPPIEPMLAKATDVLPVGAFLDEPKWDGFRALIFRGGSDVFIQSRDLRTLDRYFPELHTAFLAALPDDCVIQTYTFDIYVGHTYILGATRADIVRLVLGAGLAVVGIGLAGGLAISFAATRLLESSLYGVRPTDPATLAAVAMVLFLVAIAAHLAPVLRATRVDPSVALRQE